MDIAAVGSILLSILGGTWSIICIIAQTLWGIISFVFSNFITIILALIFCPLTIAAWVISIIIWISPIILITEGIKNRKSKK